MVRLAVAVAVLVGASFVAALPSRAGDGAAPLLARLAAVDPGLQTYKADVAFDVGLHTFPYLRKTVHGNAYFKRPARMEIVFTDLPGIARSFSNLYVGLGTPSDWERKFDIGAGEEQGEGHPVDYLVMTPRKPDRRLREVDVYVDPVVALPSRIVWHYRDGQIEMHQRFGRVEGHDLVVAQDADIRLPAMHAYVNARITNYAINVDVDEHVFTKKVE